MTREELAATLASLGLPAPIRAVPESPHRFPDGSRFHFEIASVEGPVVLRAVMAEAETHGVRIHRVSQGSGISMLSDAELDELVEIQAEHDVEVCLFLGPRGAWDTGGQSLATEASAGIARGAEAVEACIAEARRACDRGIRSLLVGDVGVLDVLGRLKAAGELPPELVLKTSAVLCAANPATAMVLERLGATSINLATDLEIGMLSALRSVTTLPLDLYVEAPDDLGGFVRQYSLPEIVRAAAPVHLKFGLRNATSVYPSGLHLEGVATVQAREKVRRAALALRLLGELAPELLEGATTLAAR